MPIPTGISGSRAAAILGLSKYATPFSVFQDIMEQRQPGFNAKKGYLYEPFEGNVATEFGHAFETPIIELTESKTGHKITDREELFMYYQDENKQVGFVASGASYKDDYRYPHITCHIDGIINGGLFEGKTVNFRAYQGDWGEPGTDRIPTAYQCQIQHNLMLTGLTEATMSVLVFPCTVQEWEKLGWQAHSSPISGHHFLKNHETDKIVDPLVWAQTFADIGNFHQYHIEAKPDTQKLLLEMYEDFWNKYVLTGTAPDAVDYEDIKRQFAEPKGTLVVKEDIAGLMRTYKDITKEIGSGGYLAKRKKFLKTQILKFAKDQTTVEDDDCVERIVFRDEQGKKVGSYDGKTYRG